MPTSISSPEPPRENSPIPTTRLRTVVGNRYPRKCAGCHETIPVGPEVKTVVDFGAPKPFPAYHAEHSPDAGRFRGRPRNQEAIPPSPGFQPASALRAPLEAPPKAPEPPKAPSPAPLALLGSAGASDATPNPASGVPWATASLTLNAGSFESARAGFADYAQPGESGEQLRARVHRVVLEDLERQVRAMRELHERLGEVPQVVPSGPRTGALQSA